MFRPYAAESVVAKRGTLKVDYASNTQAKKLFALLEKRAKVRVSCNLTHIHTGGNTIAYLRSTGSYPWYNSPCEII